MQIFEELQARGLLAQLTDEAQIRELVNNGKATFYIGFDPTADSLHVGHFMALCLMKRLQMAGNKPIALVGGGTGMIGDPSGRSDLRSMMTTETIDHNCECFKKQMSRFIEFGEGKAMMVNNAEWLRDLNYIEFIRDIGVHFSVNNMLRAECYKQRMEKGLSFLEFNYMIMQSYDFLCLYQKYGCNMQFGGDDQWSNMLGGTELIRRKLGKDAYAMTITLLLNSEGKKMGKTAKGAVWLDPDKTTPYVPPVLVEIVRRSLVGVKPYRSLGGLAHLLPFGVEEQRNGHCVCVLAQFLADQFRTAEHVAPLVISAELHIAAVLLVQAQEIVGLHDHVVELEETQSLFHALLVAFRPQHVVDGEACSDVTDEIDVIQVTQPVGIVDHRCLAFPELDEAAHLLLKAFTVVVDRLGGHHLAKVGASRRIADHRGTAAHQRDGLIACHLQALHQAKCHKVSDMKAVRRRIEADVKYGFSVVDQFPDLRLVSQLCEQTSCL